MSEEVAIALVYPDLLGTYGDGGNARILAQRLHWRGIAARVLTVTLGTPLPRTCAIYVLGGGEDAPQSLAAAELRTEGSLRAAVDDGAVVLAVCAGLQVIGTRFRGAEGVVEGVGVVDAESLTTLPSRAVGELAVDAVGELAVDAVGELAVDATGPRATARLSGYENHASATTLGRGVAPLGAVASGVGNGDGHDGFLSGRVLGTYMHGPVLARNPELADLLLGWAIGDLPPLSHPEVDVEAFALREERLAAALGRRRRRRRHHLGT